MCARCTASPIETILSKTGTMVFDMAETSQIPQIAEQLFQSVQALVEFVPVMNADNLRKALAKV